MKYPIALEPGTDATAWGVVVPDLPGCFSAGDTAEDAFPNAIEAVQAWCEAQVEEGQDIPLPQPLDVHQANPEFAGWVWALVNVDLTCFEGKAGKINITVPRRLLTRIDKYTKAHHVTRSGFLADAARRAMQ